MKGKITIITLQFFKSINKKDRNSYTLFIPQTLILSLLLFVLNLFNTPICAQEKVPSKKEIAQLVKEANEYMKAGSFDKSLMKSRLALQYAIAIKDDNLTATSYNTIAANFDELAIHDKAFFYYKKGLWHAEKTNNDILKNWINNNLGNIYCFDKQQYEKGIVHYKKSLEYSDKLHDIKQTVFTKLNITWAYFDIGRFNDGLPYLKYVNKYHEKYGDESTIVVLNMLNGMYSAYKNDTKKANSFFQNAIKSGIEGEEKSDLSYSYQEYSKFLSKTGDYKKAYENLVLYNQITAELNNEEKLKKANVAGINLEIDEYKREIDKIENQYKTKQNILLENQYKNKRFTIIIISLFIIIVILFYFFFQNTRLKQKNKLKDIKNKMQQNMINASIDGQEIERKKIAAFLHDNISGLLTSAGLHLSAFSSQNQLPTEEITKTKAILEEAHDKVRDLSHELLPALLSKFGLFYALQDLCEKNTTTIILFEYSSTIATRTRYNEKFEMKIYNIISELFNNIIKHSQASKAKLTLQEDNNLLMIQVSDNGKGFDTEKFEIGENFGLNQIQARIDKMNGTFSIYSRIGSGTSVTIKVPYLDRK